MLRRTVLYGNDVLENELPNPLRFLFEPGDAHTGGGEAHGWSFGLGRAQPLRDTWARATADY
jgi:hypothetical protein